MIFSEGTTAKWEGDEGGASGASVREPKAAEAVKAAIDCMMTWRPGEVWCIVLSCMIQQKHSFICNVMIQCPLSPE